MKKTKRKEGQLDEGTNQWMERRPELVKRLKEMKELETIGMLGYND